MRQSLGRAFRRWRSAALSSRALKPIGETGADAHQPRADRLGRHVEHAAGVDVVEALGIDEQQVRRCCGGRLRRKLAVKCRRARHPRCGTAARSSHRRPWPAPSDRHGRAARRANADRSRRRPSDRARCRADSDAARQACVEARGRAAPCRRLRSPTRRSAKRFSRGSMAMRPGRIEFVEFLCLH